MLLIDKMKIYKFSNSERIVVDFILEKQEEIKDYSTKKIALETFTSPSILIRIANKLEYDGWNALKSAYLNEIMYLKSNFHDIDPNIPFSESDSIISVANKIAKLHTDSIKDTLALIDYDELQKAAHMIRAAKNIKIFAVSNLLYIAQDFAHRLKRINKNAQTEINDDEQDFFAAMATKEDCALIISYSGEPFSILRYCKLLKENDIPIIAITGMGDNSLSKLADITLNLTTREKAYSKIGAFTSFESITLMLDILYSCYFSLDFNQNLDYKLNISRKIEVNRVIDNEIVEE